MIKYADSNDLKNTYIMVGERQWLVPCVVEINVFMQSSGNALVVAFQRSGKMTANMSAKFHEHFELRAGTQMRN